MANFVGFVGDLDLVANSDRCQVILRGDEADLVAVVLEPRMQSLLELAFATGSRVEVVHEDEHPYLLKRVKINAEYRLVR